MKRFILFATCLSMLVSASSCMKIEENEERDVMDLIYHSHLENTKWVVTRFDNVLTNLSDFPMDTLEFITNRSYMINGGNIRSYELYSRTAHAERFTFSLQDCSVFGGDFYTDISSILIADGMINNKLFNGQFDNDIIVWMEQIN